MQEDQAQEEHTHERSQGLQNTDERNGLIGDRGIHLRGRGGDPEEVVVPVEYHQAAGSAGQHGDDAAHGGGKAQDIQQRHDHGGRSHHGDGGGADAGAEQEADQEGSQDADGQTGEGLGQDVLEGGSLQHAGECAAGAHDQDDLARGAQSLGKDTVETPGGLVLFAIMSSDEFKKGKKSSPLFEEGLNVTINCWVLSASHSFV